MIQRMARYDDDPWELAHEDPGPPPAHLAAFVAGPAPAESALHVGVGDGRTAALLRAGHLTGVDTSAVALERARRRLPDAELVDVGPDEPLPFDDNSFDLVTCIEALEHIRDVQLSLSEMRRVLRPAGRLALTTPAASRIGTLIHGLEPPFSPHLHAFTSRSLRDALDSMGFTVSELRTRRRTLLAQAVR